MASNGIRCEMKDGDGVVEEVRCGQVNREVSARNGFDDLREGMRRNAPFLVEFETK